MNINVRMKSNILYKLKKTIAYSSLHKPIMELMARIHDYKVARVRPRPKSYIDTIYIVSPYKTGTTYIDSLWGNKISKHEPFHLYSLKKLEKNFLTNFEKRETLLNLKLECSGFLSLFISELPNPSCRYKYIYILRRPSQWVVSVIRHFFGLSTIGYNYINEYYWKKLLSYDMIPLLNSGEKENIDKVVNDLYNVYFHLLSNAIANEAIYFAKLEDIDALANRLGEKFGIAPNFAKSWKRESKNNFKFTIPPNPAMDLKYDQWLRKIPEGRFFS